MSIIREHAHQAHSVPESADRVVFLNDQFVDERNATLSVFDRGILHGDAVFETAFAWNGFIFKLDRHLQRLERSLKVVCITLPITMDELKDRIIETVRRNGLRNAYIKCIITRGVGPSVLLDPTGCVPSIIIFAREYLYLADPAKAANGINLKIAQIRRTPAECLDPRIKNVNYLNLILARIEAVNAGYDDTVMLDTSGHLAEVPGYNFFIVKNGVVRTPADGVLEGITRETVLELCLELSITAEECDLLPYDAYNADECFLTSTAGGLVPVRAIDGRVIGDGRPGPVRKRLSDAYEALVEGGKFRTPVYRNVA